jgi:Tol biopolymer transport system component
MAVLSSLLVAAFGAGSLSWARVTLRQRLHANGLIAWADENQILTVNTHRKTRVIVRYGNSPAWSPDGRKLAYIGSFLDPKTDNYSPRLYVMNANGMHKRRLHAITFDLFDAGSSSPPSWSPNGNALAFAGAPAGTDHVYVVHADGSGLRKLTNGGEDIEPVWSPDGSQIAFVRGVKNAAVYVTSADGSGERKLAEGGGLLGRPLWSPDGSKIAFTGNRGGAYVINADGSDQRSLSDGDSLVWSPDGSKIAFTGSRGGVYVMNADGSRQHKLANGFGPVWSPDGRKIAFQRGSQFSPSNGIYVISADGSRIRRLNHLGYGGSVDIMGWQPLP